MQPGEITLNGKLAVVWRVDEPGVPELVHNVYVNDLMSSFSLTLRVSGRELWVLDDMGGRVFLTHYFKDRRPPISPEVAHDLAAALTGNKLVPPRVWARAVFEAHKRAHINGCQPHCDHNRGILLRSGLL